MSPSSRRAWIEILLYSLTSVAKRVALLAEGVDRNIVPLEQVIYCRVALLAEGVDRNLNKAAKRGTAIQSPSSRRAWIEICGSGA